MKQTKPDEELWAVEYSRRQGQFHIQRAATIQHVGDDWERIGTVQGTFRDANKFCNEWISANQ